MLLPFALLGCAEEPAPREIDSGFARFRDEVVPVLERRCAAGCHGVPDDAWPPQEEGEVRGLHFPVDLDGHIPAGQLRVAYERVCDPTHRIEPGAGPDFSPLLRHPLADDCGGLPHGGWDVFADDEDPDYRTLRRWVAAEAARLPADAPPPPEEVFFRDNVLGVMVRNGCFLQSCHGPDAFNDLKLMPPLPRADVALDPPAGFSPRMVHHDRLQMLGKKARFANLGGDLRLSRLLVKNLPIGAGGVHQRGGNGQFFSGADDPDVVVLLDWLRLERDALRGRLHSGGRSVGDVGVLRGMAFVRRPEAARRRFFEVDPYQPGAELWIAPEGGAPFRLDLFDAPVDIQGLDVRYDARAIVFSARRGADDVFRLYEVELDDALAAGAVRVLTEGPPRAADGTPVHHLDPLYIPGPRDPDALDDVAIAYASNAAGEWALSAQHGLLGEPDGGDPLTVVDAQRTEAPGTFTGRRVAFVDGPLTGERRRIVAHEADPRSVVGARLSLDRPLPDAPDRRSTYVIEVPEPLWRPAYDIWRVMPGQPQTARRMTHTSAQERRPTLRSTGEVMFTSVRNVGDQGGRPVFNGAIFRVMAGGFDYHIHGGNRSRHALYADARELPQGLEVRLATDPRGWWGGGLLVLADHGFGINLEPDNPVDRNPFTEGDLSHTATQRYLAAQLALSPEIGARAVTSVGQSPGGSFRDPYPLPDGSVLVAHAAHAVDHLDPTRAPDWDLYRLTFPDGLQSQDGRHAGPIALRRLPGSTAGAAEYLPRPILVRPKEKAHTEQKFAWRADGRKPEDVDGVLRMPAGTPAVVECYDYPLLESFLTDFAPRGARTLRPDLAGVRVVAQQPPGRADLHPTPGAPDSFATPVGIGVHAPSRIVAEVPLEPDGSFYVEVPAEVPLKLQGLDADGMALHSMNRWFYVQPGEKLTFAIPRSVFPLRCAGCHGALTGDRTDALGPPDIVTSASRVMATWNPEARRRRPPHRQAAVTVDFRRDVQPILDRACVRCHDRAPLELRGEATALYTVAYETLRARDDDGAERHVAAREASAARSPLIRRLRGDDAGARHPPDAPLAPAELRTLVRWIDLGATFLGARP